MERFAIKFDEKIPLNLRKICRLCGTNNSADTLILEDKTIFGDGDVELWKKIQACVGIKVYKNDKLPKNICHLCHDKILDFFEFREMCLSIDSQTRRMLGLSTLEPKKRERKRKSELDAISPIDSKLTKLNNDELLVPNKIVKPRNQGKDTNKKKKTSTKDIKDIKLEQNYEFHSLEAKNFNQKTFNETTNGKKNRICSICDGTFNSIKFEEHLSSVHVPRIFHYHCVRCNETMVNKVDIKNHNLWHKLSKTPYICGRCNKQIDSLPAYTRHINDCLVSDQSVVYPNVKCHVCDKEFETQNLYDMHQCVIVTLKCPKCNKTFSNSGNTLKHIVRCNVKTSLQKLIKGQQQQLQINKTSTAFTESNAFVMIPASSGVTLNSSELSSSSSSPTLNSMKNANEKNKKCKKLTKKDMQRFDDLLKSTYETLQNIKQEPKDNTTVPVTATTTTAVDSNPDAPVASDAPDTPGANDNNDEQNINDNMSTLEKEVDEHEEETNHHADDNYSSDEEIQTAVNVKQEVIDIHYTDIEKSVSGSTETHPDSEKTAETQNEKEQQEQQQQQQQPTIKLKIKLEHGTLNSSLIDENNSENLSQDIGMTKKKKKKKNIDKSTTDKTLVCNIKQEPMGHEEEEEHNLQNSEQTNTQNNEIENNENENENTNNENHNVINNSKESSLPIICAVSSLANQINNNNSQSQNSTLPIISSVYSGVHIESSSNTDSISKTLSANIAIKQEIMEEDHDNNLTTNPNETMTNENEVHETEDNNVTRSVTSFPTTENISSEMLRIKKEIDYEEYTNQEQNIGNYSQNLDNEIQQNNTLSSFMDDITIKEELHISYDAENLMECDYGNNDEELNNVSTLINSDKTTEMEVCQSENENIENLTLMKVSETENENIENSILMKISETENENIENSIENDKLENNLSSNIPDSSFSFKRIVLKNFENTEIEKPISDTENCSKNTLEEQSIPPIDSNNTLDKIITPTDSNSPLDKKVHDNENVMSSSGAENEVIDIQNQANEESKVIEGPSYLCKSLDDVNNCTEDVNNCTEKNESIQNVVSQIESENDNNRNFEISRECEINNEIEKSEINENNLNETISNNPKSQNSLKLQNFDDNSVQEKFNNYDENITSQTSHIENSEIIKNLNDIENEKVCEINHEDITDGTETLHENKNDEQEELHEKDMEEFQTADTVLSENDNDDDKMDENDLNENAGLLEEHMTENEQDNQISENDKNDGLELESDSLINATTNVQNNEENNQKNLEKLNEISLTELRTQDEKLEEDLKIVEKILEATEMSDSSNFTEFCENTSKPPVDNDLDVEMQEDNDAKKSDNKIITLQSNIENNCDQQNDEILNTENIEKNSNDYCSTENSSKSDNLIEKIHDSNTLNENLSDKIHDDN